jgi:hypothetical protein
VSEKASAAQLLVIASLQINHARDCFQYAFLHHGLHISPFSFGGLKSTLLVLTADSAAYRETIGC